MNARRLWGRILVIAGGIGMLIGAIDPLEGSVIVLAGSGLVMLGTFLEKDQRKRLQLWFWVIILIALGVGIMWGLSRMGGLGGDTGRSLWWALLILPYPAGWLVGMVSLIGRTMAFFKSRRPGDQTAG